MQRGVEGDPPEGTACSVGMVRKETWNPQGFPLQDARLLSLFLPLGSTHLKKPLQPSQVIALK